MLAISGESHDVAPVMRSLTFLPPRTVPVPMLNIDAPSHCSLLPNAIGM